MVAWLGNPEDAQEYIFTPRTAPDKTAYMTGEWKGGKRDGRDRTYDQDLSFPDSKYKHD